MVEASERAEPRRSHPTLLISVSPGPEQQESVRLPRGAGAAPLTCLLRTHCCLNISSELLEFVNEPCNTRDCVGEVYSCTSTSIQIRGLMGGTAQHLIWQRGLQLVVWHRCHSAGKPKWCRTGRTQCSNSHFSSPSSSCSCR